MCGSTACRGKPCGMSPASTGPSIAKATSQGQPACLQAVVSLGILPRHHLVLQGRWGGAQATISRRPEQGTALLQPRGPGAQHSNPHPTSPPFSPQISLLRSTTHAPSLTPPPPAPPNTHTHTPLPTHLRLQAREVVPKVRNLHQLARQLVLALLGGLHRGRNNMEEDTNSRCGL